MKLWQFGVLAVTVVLVSMFVIQWYYFPQTNVFRASCFFAGDTEFLVMPDSISYKGVSCSYFKEEVPKNVAEWQNSGNPRPEAEPDNTLRIDSECFKQFGLNPSQEFLVLWRDRVGVCRRMPAI